MRHDLRHPHQHILSLRTSRKKSRVRPLLSHQQWQQKFQQRHHTHPILHHQMRHVIHVLSGTCCTLLWLQTCHPSLHNSQRNGPSSAQMHHDNRQQHHSSRTHHGHHDTKSIQSMNQRFHWLKCCHVQQQFLYLWHRGVNNRADYASKHHPAKHHQAVWSFYIEDTHYNPKNSFSLSSPIHLHLC